MLKLICLNDSHKPEDISSNNWIKKGEIYTLVKVIKSKLSGDLAAVLEEISPNNPLYNGYNIKRFVPVVPVEDLEKELQELIELENVQEY